MQQVSGMPGGFGLPPVANPPGGLGNSVRLVKLETDHLGGEVALGAILQVTALASAAFTRQQPRLDLRTSEATRNVSRRCLRLRGILKCRKGLDTRCLRDADNGLQHGEGPSPWLGPRVADESRGFLADYSSGMAKPKIALCTILFASATLLNGE